MSGFGMMDCFKACTTTSQPKLDGGALHDTVLDDHTLQLLMTKGRGVSCG